MRRKLPVIILFSLFLLGQGGYYLAYTWEQERIREEMQGHLLAQLPDASLVQFYEEEAGNNLHWNEAGKEFTCGGKLYDVARIKKQDGRTIIYCMEDGKEEKLLSELSRKISTENTAGGKYSVEKFQQPDWVSDYRVITLPPVEQTTEHLKFPFFAEKVKARAGPVNTPPPDPALPVSTCSSSRTVSSVHYYPSFNLNSYARHDRLADIAGRYTSHPGPLSQILDYPVYSPAVCGYHISLTVAVPLPPCISFVQT